MSTRSTSIVLGDPPLHDAVNDTRNANVQAQPEADAMTGTTKELALTTAAVSEILVIDPLVPDVSTVLLNLRRDVEAILLDAARPAAGQIALKLADREGLSAIHVMAHGSPGRVTFATGEWTAEDAGDQSLDGSCARSAARWSPEGELRLWSCDVGPRAQRANSLLML